MLQTILARLLLSLTKCQEMARISGLVSRRCRRERTLLVDPSNPIAPYMLAMLLCDQVITDSATKKKTLVGIFSTVASPEFPRFQQMALFARLTDAEGTYRLRVDYVHVTDGETVGTVEANEPVEIPNRLGIFDLVLPFTMPIPKPGQYEFRLFANNAYLGRVTFVAVQLVLPEEPADAS
jgi:hypothetical protein